MKIAVDASRTVNEKAGVAKYIDKLIEELLKIDSYNFYTLLYFYLNDTGHLKKNKINNIVVKNAQTKIFRIPGKIKEIFWQNKFLKMPDNLIGPQNIFFAPSFIDLGLGSQIPQVLSLYDLTYFKFPEHLGFQKSIFAQNKTKAACQKAVKIITISQNSKKDIIDFLNVPEKKIHVTYLAADQIYKPIKQKEKLVKILKKYKLPLKFILTVGTLSPRKNYEMLFEAFNQLPRNIKKEFKLVVVGQRGWNFDKIFKKVDDLELSEKIIFLENVTDDDLVCLYNLATVFVFPSLYEGFGLPIVEAMACGTPVISSNTSSMPEVIGQAGILVTPHCSADWMREILKLIASADLRQKYVIAGLSQAKKFSWAKTAKETLKIFEQAGKKNG